MSHKIETNDRIISTEKTWHRLEELRADIKTFPDTGLNWELDKREMFFADKDGNQIVIPKLRQVVRTDIDAPLGTVKESYQPIQNSEIFDCISKALDGVDHEIVTSGSLRNCKNVFLSVRLLDDQEHTVNADEFKNFLTFTSAHDGSGAFKVFDTSMRVVCWNTLCASEAASQRGTLEMKVTHKGDTVTNVSNMAAQIETLFEKRAEFYESLTSLTEQSMTAAQAEKILIGFEFRDAEIDKLEKVSTRAQNKTAEMVSLFNRGAGNKGETVYDLLNGFTEFHTHRINKNNARSRFESSDFGTAATRKVEFLDECLTDGALDALADKGEQVLALV